MVMGINLERIDGKLYNSNKVRMSRCLVQLCVYKESELPLVVQLGHYILKYMKHK